MLGTLRATREFLSTPSARRATPARPAESHDQRISIHALREEGDQGGELDDLVAVISIHALREEGDRFWILCSSIQKQFLSTPSARRATDGGIWKLEAKKFLSTPSARRATPSLSEVSR